MKKHSTLLIPIIFCFVLNTACKKYKPIINPEEVRLTALKMTVNNGRPAQISFVYDASGKITRITSTWDSASRTFYDVIYNANEIMMAKPAVNSIASNLTDTVWLILDGNNRVTKRIWHVSEEHQLPPQRNYTFDTTAYEYDAAGLLSKDTRGLRDSSWSSDVTVETINTRTTIQSTYTNSNGDLTRVNSLYQITSTIRKPSITYQEIYTATGILTFDYSNSFPNQTDFSNAAVLNQFLNYLGLFAALPMNKNYHHLPNHTQMVYTRMDQNGTTLYTTTSIGNSAFTYNSYGFVESKMDPLYSDTKMTFVYSQ